VILGAAGRDFHNFNMVFRSDPDTEVIAFTATQIPEIAGRRYPPELAGPLYPNGIPIVDADGLARLCVDERIDLVVFAYSDVTHGEVMHKASIALAAGADFMLLGPRRTMLKSALPVIAVCAVRTGCGKSQTARWLSRRLAERGLRAAVIRHPMPYGDLARQRVQRFATPRDLDAAACTVEEREEYEPHVEAGNVVFAGADYAEILAAAAAEADLVIWDGGNNDLPFVAPDLMIGLLDPLRAGDETAYHPGETILRMADILVVAKADSATAAQIAAVSASAAAHNPGAPLVCAHSVVTMDEADRAAGRRVLVVEDGPTITHGGMASGAGLIAAHRAGAAEIVDPRAAATPAIAGVFKDWSHIGPVLPALGYSTRQLEELRRTIDAADADVVVSATPCDLARLIAVNKPILRVRYEFAEAGSPGLGALVDAFLDTRGLAAGGN
jgi:predicted GTPase